MNCLSEIDDPRKPSNGTLHDFLEMLVIAVAAALSDCDTVEDIAYWARAKETWLRKFLALTNGVPSEENFLRVFRVLDPKQFESAFRRWVGGIVGALSGSIAVDGKTVRGSGSGGETAIHMVSAFATDLGIVLGQEKVSGKSNELTAIPELLEALYLKGFLVSIDAMVVRRRSLRRSRNRVATTCWRSKGINRRCWRPSRRRSSTSAKSKASIVTTRFKRVMVGWLDRSPWPCPPKGS